MIYDDDDIRELALLVLSGATVADAAREVGMNVAYAYRVLHGARRTALSASVRDKLREELDSRRRTARAGELRAWQAAEIRAKWCTLRYSKNALAEMYGVSQQAVDRVVRMRTHKESLTPEMRDRLKAANKQLRGHKTQSRRYVVSRELRTQVHKLIGRDGHSCRSAAKIIGCSHATVWRVMNGDAKITVRS